MPDLPVTLPRAPSDALSPTARRWLRASLVAAYLSFALVLATALRAGHSDLDKFFWPAAEIAAHGHPLLIYSVRSGAYPNANGPLSLVPLTLVALVANALDFANNVGLRNEATLIVFSVFSLLMTREAVRIIEQVRGRGSRPLLTYVAFLMSLPLLIALACYGHVEVPLELWLTLIALRLLLSRRLILAGAVMGLVLLTRTTAVVALFTFAMVVLADASVATLGRRLANAATLIGSALAVGALGLLPFLIADRHNVIYSLVTYRGQLPIAGGSLWVLLGRGLPWASLIQHQDTVLFTAAAIVLIAMALRRTRGVPLTPERICGLLAISALCVPLLAKTSWAYYMCDPYIFATIWWLARPVGHARDQRVYVPILLSGLCLMLATRELQVPPPPIQVVEGVVSGVVVLGCLGILLSTWHRAGRDPHPQAP